MTEKNEHKFIFGSGAQGRVINDILIAQYPDSRIYFIDDNHDVIHLVINHTKVISVVEMFELEQFPKVHIAIGNPIVRSKIYDRLKKTGVILLSAIHPSAIIMPSSTIKAGAMIGAGAVINSNVMIGLSCIVNTGVIIEHDTVLDDFSCISPGATIGGRVSIGKNAFVSSCAVVKARTIIGENSIIGMGSVVMKNVEKNTIVFGTPARQKGIVDEKFDWTKIF